MDRTYRIVITLISFLFAVTPVLSNANIHHTGATLGQFEVGGSGDANYTVPLAIPPGIAGMQPSLSLVYSSQGGNGTLGVGWALSGLSAVHRCGGTIAQDGKNNGVNYTTEDKLCIDGQRLVAISGIYGADGTEYRTEKDSYSKIISHGAIASGPQWFEVKTKGGQIIEYGNTTDSAIEAEGKTDIRLWAVNKISDTAGNYLTFTYTEVNDTTNSIFEYYPDRIDYTGNDSAVLSTFAHIKFNYEDRTDKTPQYVGGSKITSTQRLKTIQTFINETTKVREYQLGYENTGSQSLSKLISLTECSGDATCKPATIFDWQDSTGDFGTTPPEIWASNSNVSANVDTGNLEFLIGVSSSLGISFWAGDVNGDGYDDLVTKQKDEKMYVGLSNGKTFTEPLVQWGSDVILPDNSFWPTWLKDVDGDGMDDLIMAEGSGNISVYRSLGNTFASREVWAHTSEVGGVRETVVGDVNGDGKADLVFIKPDGSYHVGLSAGNDFSVLEQWGTGLVWEYDYSNIPPAISDVNGDGYGDLIISRWYSPKAVHVYLSNGKNFSTGEVWKSITTSIITHIVDVNGDGKADLIASDGYEIRVGFSNGKEFGALGWFASVGVYTKTGDVNGDGKYDGIDAIVGVKTFISESPLPDLLTTITNGLGDTTTISYKTLTDSTVYTPDSDGVYPIRDIHRQGPMYVVDSYNTSNGIGGNYSFNYKYGGAKTHLTGHGFLGFRWMEITDTNTGIVTRTEYNQTFPTNGLADKIEVRLSDSTLIEQTINSWQSYTNTDPDNDPGTSEALYTISLSNTTKRTYELDGTQINRTYTQNYYDAYGNATYIYVWSYDANDNFFGIKMSINEYTNDSANWYLGRLTRAAASSFASGSSGGRISAFEYDPVTGLLTKEIIEPDRTNFKLVTDYGYDSYGHKTSVTVSGDASAADPIASRTTTTSYDYTNLGLDGTYTTTTSNALGHKETKMIDVRFGTVVMLVGPNSNYNHVDPLNLVAPPNLATIWEYDTLGRKVKETRADGTYTTIAYDHCDAQTPCTPSNAALKTTTQVASTTIGTTPLPASITYFDKLGREVRSEGVGFDGTPVYKDAVYNNRGKVEQVSMPYFSGGTIHWTSYQYDVLGRVIQETRPDTSVVTRSYAMTASGHQTTERIVHSGDEIDQSTSKLNNSLGQLIQVTDNAGGTINYTYDAFGNLLTTTDSVGNIVSMTYDIRGRKTAMDDPDMGHWEYRHNVFGELVWQKDAKLNEVTMSYDVLGRMVSRTELEGTTTWVYDTAWNKGVGKLATVTGPNSNYIKQFLYDGYGRSWLQATSLNGVYYYTSTSYDAYSRVAYQAYPNGFSTKNIFNAQGFLSEVQNASTNQPYWQANEANALGQTTLETFGNNVQTVRLYDDVTGHMTGISSGVGASSSVQLLAYAYDALGNLKTRQDTNRTLTEDFTYDNLNRLTGTTLNNVQGTTFQYDSIGNITYKSDVGNYTYGENGAGPHAVTTAGANTYTYDINGNQKTSSDGRYVNYRSYNKLASTFKGSSFRMFYYAPNRSRYFQYHWDGTTATTTHNIGALYEKIDKSNSAVTEHKYYIFSGGKRVAIYTSKSDASPSTTRYIHTDHLGSIDTITDETGAVVENLSFDAFGKRRVAGDWSVLSGLLTVMNTNRGFTGHEHLDDVGLIHMNGRVYDPTLGRFLSADPFVQFPKNTQSLNRYSYVLNNPLSYTDPSGFGLWKKIKKGWKKLWKSKIFKIVVAIVLAPYAGLLIGQMFSSALAGYMGAGFAGGLIASGGDLKAAAIGAITGGLAYGVSSAFSGVAETIGHGVVGGAAQELGGGKFKDGFWSGGFRQATSGALGNINSAIGRVIANAVIGGTASKLGGGKFANGARTFGFLRLFKEIPDYYRKTVGYNLDIGPGGDAVQKTEFSPPVKGANNIGFQGGPVSDPCFLCEDGSGSKLLNQWAGVNAVGGYHDTMQISMGPIARNVFNVPGMAVAAGVTYSGFIGQALNAAPENLYVPINVGRKRDRKSRYMWAPASGF